DNIADNGSFATATDFGSLGDRVETSLTLHATYDQDYYQFTAASTGEVSVTLTYQGGDPNLFVYDASQTEIGRSTKNFGTENVTVDVVGGETYYIKAENFQYLDDIVDNYALQIEGPAAEVSTSAAKRSVVEGQTFNVTVHRTGPIFDPLIADLTFGGSAVLGVDYTVDTTTASFGAETETVDITITVLQDGIKESTELIQIGVAEDPSIAASPVKTNVVIREGFQTPVGITPATPITGPEQDEAVGQVGLLRMTPGSRPNVFPESLATLPTVHAGLFDEAPVRAASPFSDIML
ncbi:MAG: PPC domain-containing protein, partial [Planctomycetota bacterium]